MWARNKQPLQPCSCWCCIWLQVLKYSYDPSISAKHDCQQFLDYSFFSTVFVENLKVFFVLFSCVPTLMKSPPSHDQEPWAPCICVVTALIHSIAKWRLWLFEVNPKISPCVSFLVLALPTHAALLALYQFNLCFVRSLCQVIVLQYGKIEEFFTMYSNVTTITGTLFFKKNKTKKQTSLCILVNDFAVSLLNSRQCSFTEINSLKGIFLSKWSLFPLPIFSSPTLMWVEPWLTVIDPLLHLDSESDVASWTGVVFMCLLWAAS